MPFPVLQGEGVEYLGHADEAIIAISNYRLHIKFKDSVINVSVMAITGKRRAEASGWSLNPRCSHEAVVAVACSV